ncbi:ATP-binding protein [Halonotius terrestris]|uniref:ATP-binding protein n=1 Tax=Halonotius terrestris TaxID=2487750 RepID=A0A8J8PD30_9EURY|nr:ATP-binding protein [Halonotius terrestris]TQQ82987.1 ATP-binding protein [Halonotius terrestris]
MVIGIVSKPGENTNEFVIVTPDDTEIKTGEFVYYKGDVEVQNDDGSVVEQEKKIFARVTGREQQRGFPDQFMADPGVSPDAVARKLGISTEGVDLYNITATVIGYYDEKLNDFTNPRIVPKPGTEIRLASDSDLEEYLTEAVPEEGSAFIGDLIHRPPEQTEIHLPIDAFASTHLSVLASTGSGKSYTASVLIEEMMQPDSRAAVLVLDPHGEYGSLKQMEEGEKFQDGDYAPEVQIKRPESIQIRISELSLGDLFSIIDDPSDPQEQVLAEAWNQLQSEEDDYISINDLQNKVEEVGDEKDLESSARALDWRIDKALDRDLFDHSNHLSLSELLEPGQCTVLQLDTMDQRDQQMMVSVLFRKINQERVAHEKGRESELEFPVFGLLEEGHRFAPADGDARSLPVLSTILSEGRKFGVGIGIISQRPSKIDDDVLSQCKTQIIMQIQNPLDQDAVKKGVEDVGEDLLDELPGLTPGQAIIAGDSVNTPFLSRIRNRYTEHDAESLEATKLWQESWKEQQREPDGMAEPEDEEGASNRDQPLD